MADRRYELEVTVSIAWWWWLYVAGVVTASYLTGAQPDMEKVRRVALRATRVHARVAKGEGPR
jgi:hypothetical protein